MFRTLPTFEDWRLTSKVWIKKADINIVLLSWGSERISKSEWLGRGDLLTRSGLQEGRTSFLANLAQSMPLKNGWSLISLTPLSRQPSRSRGFFSRSWLIRETASWENHGG